MRWNVPVFLICLAVGIFFFSHSLIKQDSMGAEDWLSQAEEAQTILDSIALSDYSDLFDRAKALVEEFRDQPSALDVNPFRQ